MQQDTEDSPNDSEIDLTEELPEIDPFDLLDPYEITDRIYSGDLFWE